MKRLALVLIVMLLTIGLWADEQEGPVSIEGEALAESWYNSEDDAFLKLQNKIVVKAFDIVTLEVKPGLKRYFLSEDNEFRLWQKLKIEYPVSFLTFGTSVESADPVKWLKSADYEPEGAVFEKWKTWVEAEAGPICFAVNGKFNIADDDVDFFMGAELSAKYSSGPLEVAAGYLFTETAEGKEVGPDDPLTNGGMFVKAKLTY